MSCRISLRLGSSEHKSGSATLTNSKPLRLRSCKMLSCTIRSRASRSSLSTRTRRTPFECKAVIISMNAGRFAKSLAPLTADRRLYARTKRALARKEWKYAQNYADAKTAVIEEILARARLDRK